MILSDRFSLTQMEKTAAATAQDCMRIVLDKVTNKVRELSKADNAANGNVGQSFTYVETDFFESS